MKKGRTILILGLILSLITSMATMSSALPKSVAEQEKVQLLDDLNIFTGYNGDYRLNDKLSRSEAAALAVRMLAKELHVLGNTADYNKTPYPDVEASSWYASYVGYCTKEGILSGDTTGYYKPNDFTTEKSFIKIILGVLGYEINKDFTWINIYKKAFEVGLVSELSYIAKEDDNPDFKRRDAVNIMYNALALNGKNAEKALFYKLIDAGILTIEEAIKLKLIDDEIVTDVAEILIFDENKISIVFNEKIKAIDQVKIYAVNSEDKRLPLGIEELKEDYIMLKTEKQIPGLEYTVEFQKVTDANGNVQEVIYTSFVGFMSKEVVSDFFRIQKIEPVNEKSVKVFFTHPVNINSENALYYTLSSEDDSFASGDKDQLLARLVTSEERCVLLSLKNRTFVEGETYRVEISAGMTSAYGVKMNDGEGDEMAFTAVAGQEDVFSMLDAIPYESNTILLNFNKEVNPFLAQQIYNFYVTDKDSKPIAIEKVTVESQGLMTGQVVFLQLKERMKKEEKYYITINNLNDVTRQEFITERTYSFIADYGTTESLEIVDVKPIDIQTVDVYFSNMLDPITAVNLNYYSAVLRNSNTTVYPKGVLYEAALHPYKVTLFFAQNDLVQKKEYELKASYEIKDYLGNKAGVTLKERFNASTEEKIIPSVEEVTPISTNAVKLALDKELAFHQTNLSPNNYTLEYSYQGVSIKKLPLNVLYINAKTLVLIFDQLEYEIQYTLRIDQIIDYSGTSYKVTGQGTNFVNFVLEEQD